MRRIFVGMLIAALSGVAACSPAGTNTTNQAVNTNSSASTGATSPSQAAATPAASQLAADALVAELYKQHGEQRGPLYQTKDRALVEKYFEKSLADLIWKDAVESRGKWALSARTSCTTRRTRRLKTSPSAAPS